MDINGVVSRNIRRFRIDRRYSMGDLARLAGVAKQTLSTIEAGRGNPTIETLTQVAAALNVPFRSLFTEWGSRTRVGRAADAQWEEHPAGQIRNIEQVFGSGYVRTHMVRMEAGIKYDDVVPAHEPGTLHQLVVVEGEVEVGPVEELVTLGVGDWARFPGDVEHVFRCLSPVMTAVMVTTAPQPELTPRA